jgi:hypothetical protein
MYIPEACNFFKQSFFRHIVGQVAVLVLVTSSSTAPAPAQPRPRPTSTSTTSSTAATAVAVPGKSLKVQSDQSDWCPAHTDVCIRIYSVEVTIYTRFSSIIAVDLINSVQLLLLARVHTGESNHWLTGRQ